MGVNAAVIGEAPFDADGATWRLCFSMNALCRLEAGVADQAEVEALLKGEPPSMSAVRVALWSGLVDHHPTVSLDDAGRLIDHLGKEHAASLIYQALVLAFPPPDDKARPRKATRSRSKA